jgi:tripartite-type tricarboxylate transporter receptor subunit TctC
MTPTARLRVAASLCIAALGPCMSCAIAQEYPNKAIRCIVPFTAGGGTDSIARLVGQKLSDAWGQPFLVENRPGADGRIATEMVAKAAPDGYTILLVSNLHSISASVFSKLPYDPVRDFSGVTLAARSPNLLVVHPSVPVKTMDELVKLAKSKPGKLNYGTSGLAQTGHVSGELLKSMVGIDVTHIPYKGTAEAVTAVLGGHVDIAFASVASALPHVKAGTLRALAITTATRAEVAPEVPTMVESGFPGFVTATWYGFLVPAATPRPIVTKLNAEIVKILKMPEVRERLLASGLEPSPNAPEEFDEFIRTEIVRFGKVVKEAGIRLE